MNFKKEVLVSVRRDTVLKDMAMVLWTFELFCSYFIVWLEENLKYDIKKGYRLHG
jgi:hypothetical protein